MDRKNYDEMLSRNAILSREKVRRAIDAIHELDKDYEEFSIAELVRRTGLSRSFFYNNEKVNKELEDAIKRNQNTDRRTKKLELFDHAQKKSIALLEKKVAVLKEENKKLRNENLELQRMVEQLKVDIIELL